MDEDRTKDYWDCPTTSNRTLTKDEHHVSDEENKPSTSKKALKGSHSSESQDDSRGDQKSYSSYTSKAYSARSLDMDDAGLNMPKSVNKTEIEKVLVNENPRMPKRKLAAGRVSKRKRPPARRQMTRRAKRKPKPKPDKRQRDASLSTIFTRLSSGSKTTCCLYCGHRCCRRYKRQENRRCTRNGDQKCSKKVMPTNAKTPIHVTSGAEANQMGSRAQMLSPLFVKSHIPSEKPAGENELHSEVTPEMIHQALRRLCMWQQGVKTELILHYIKSHYPVDPDITALSEDLAEKLNVAVLAGIVTSLPNDCWCLPTALQKRALTKTHVTLFWKAYVDTMKPVTRREVNIQFTLPSNTENEAI